MMPSCSPVTDKLATLALMIPLFILRLPMFLSCRVVKKEDHDLKCGTRAFLFFIWDADLKWTNLEHCAGLVEIEVHSRGQLLLLQTEILSERGGQCDGTLRDGRVSSQTPPAPGISTDLPYNSIMMFNTVYPLKTLLLSAQLESTQIFKRNTSTNASFIHESIEWLNVNKRTGDNSSAYTCALLGLKMVNKIPWKLVPSVGDTDRATSEDRRVSGCVPTMSFSPTVSTIFMILNRRK